MKYISAFWFWASFFLLGYFLSSVAHASPLSDWQSHMTQYAWPVCTYLKDPNQDFGGHLNNTYYDGERVFFQICDYTHDPLYCECAQAAEQIYRDQYLIPNNGSLPGYWIFADGLAEDLARNGDQQSSVAYHVLMSNGAFVQSSPWNDANQPDWSYIRETAYALRLHIMAPKFGMNRNSARITQLVNFQLGQLDQFFGSKTAPYRKPFMTGLASEALIDYYEHIQQDGTILVALRQAADYMWNNMWLASDGAFQYTDDPRPTSIPGNSCSQGEEPCGQGREPAPDLNQLIAPLYEWLYQRTGLQKYRDQGDAIFAGGVTGAYLLNGKQFNQSYRWSFKYVELRYGASNPTPSPTPQATNTATPISTRTPTPRPTATSTPSPSPIPTIQPTSTPVTCPTAKPCPTCPVVTPCPAVTPCAECPPICPKAIAASFDGGVNWKTLNFWKRTSKCRYK